MTAPIVKLSQLAAATALTGAETVPVVQGGVTKRTTSADLIPIPVEKFTFDTTVEDPPAFGEMAWNSEDMTVDVGLSGGVVLQLGQETLMKVKADEALASGQLIMATGADGNSGRIRAAKANGTGSVNAIFVIGIATQAIAANALGFVTTFGILKGINTTGAAVSETWANGDVLYPHPTIPGALTKGTHVLDLPIAIVLFAGNNGSIFVRR
jgi:hypothetical protein